MAPNLPRLTRTFVNLGECLALIASWATLSAFGAWTHGGFFDASPLCARARDRECVGTRAGGQRDSAGTILTTEWGVCITRTIRPCKTSITLSVAVACTCRAWTLHRSSDTCACGTEETLGARVDVASVCAWSCCYLGSIFQILRTLP